MKQGINVKIGQRASRAALWSTYNLFADAQLGDQSTIALDVLGHQIIQQLAALTDHLVQTTAGVVVLLVDLQVSTPPHGLVKLPYTSPSPFFQ